ncbi:hypothetical protein BDN72DRAFT_74348 [Pluteus cervinus]|uniref:Uncharacterized protein n=1 Tax=Pluteus cervinus TaxID=181527 RepID=A0ACD3AQG9_9AGAR|nr:hypothetical protein BDN72DRAFT_74348 [Pluteus cervinus]
MDNLPMELVLRIVSESGLNLFVIAQLSRSFNSLATSQYFHARPDHHIDSLTLHFDGLKTTVSPQCTFSKTFQATDVLSLLSIAFDIQTVGKFVWAVISTDPLIPGRRLISYYHHLTTFLRRLKHVDHISLDFHGRETGRTVHIVLPSRLDEWTVAMTDLLNACVEMLKMNPNGAEGFSVKGGLPLIGHEAEPGREHWWRLNPKILGFFKHTPNPSLRGTDQGLNFRIPRITSSTRRIITSPGARSVLKRTKKFTISSSILLHPPLCGWTHEFLSSATLNSLTLDGLHYYEGWWRVMLPWLATPLQRLEEFTIQRCQNVPAISLAKFLHNLRGLKHCNINIDPNYQPPVTFYISQVPKAFKFHSD